MIGGMTCVNCQNRIERALLKTAGVSAAHADYGTGHASVSYDDAAVSFDELTSVIESLDYEVLTGPDRERQELVRTISLTVIIVSLFVLLQRFGVLTLLVPDRLADGGMGYGMLFVTGLLTSVHCVAMCGGIALSQCLPRSGEDTGGAAFMPAVWYNLGRVVSYTAVGGLLGGIGYLAGGGSGAGVPVLAQGILKIIAGLLMIVMGVNMLGIFPGLRRFTVRLPGRLAMRVEREKARSRQPFIVGLLNGLMPCGPLQSMQIVALASGSPLTGALSMLLFSLGTVPLMLGLGTLVSALGKRFTRAVMNVGAVLVVVLGLAMLSQGGSLSGMLPPNRVMILIAALALAGIVSCLPLSDKRIKAAGAVAAAAVVIGAGLALTRVTVFGERPAVAQVEDGVQIVYSTLTSGSYPTIRVKEDIPVRWTIYAPDGSVNGCNYRMLIRDLGIEYEFAEGDNVIEFTPSDAGTVSYSCWMGMLHGEIIITS